MRSWWADPFTEVALYWVPLWLWVCESWAGSIHCSVSLCELWMCILRWVQCVVNSFLLILWLPISGRVSTYTILELCGKVFQSLTLLSKFDSLSAFSCCPAVWLNSFLYPIRVRSVTFFQSLFSTSLYPCYLIDDSLGVGGDYIVWFFFFYPIAWWLMT